GDTTEIGLRYILAKRKLPDDFLAYTPLGPGIARVAAIQSGSFPGALIDTSQVADMKKAQKLGKLHMLIDLNKEVHMVFGGCDLRCAHCLEPAARGADGVGLDEGARRCA